MSDYDNAPTDPHHGGKIWKGPACKYGDPLCPCPDGDLCHYEGDGAWPAPRIVSHQNNPLSDILRDALAKINT